jgi:DNA gyrase inhibitor GyrI
VVLHPGNTPQGRIDFTVLDGDWCVAVRVQLNNSTTFEHPVLTLCAEEAPESSKEAPVGIVFPHRAAPPMAVSEFEARLQVDIPPNLIALPGSQF